MEADRDWQQWIYDNPIDSDYEYLEDWEYELWIG